ncbi:MAG: nicotinate-nucleotide--dimethylbenzimidazole phosphoribosyltransferase [Chitinophagaceae bacterium]
MSLKNQLQNIINNKTKPVGALGHLETIALQAGLIQQTTTPRIQQPEIIVFAGDHGIARTGLVNPYPPEVTAQMVLNFLQGGAAINVFCRQHAIALKVVDAGVQSDIAAEAPGFIKAKTGYGTSNYLEGPAMSETLALQAIEKGKLIVRETAQAGCNCIGFGEMGIGNTSSATLIMSAITGISVAQCTGRGTGVNDQQLQTKIKTLQQASETHQLQQYKDQPIELLSKIGGFEIAMMTGAYVEAAAQKMIIVVDGFITTAALLLAQLIDPAVIDNCIFAHTSGEQGHEKMLAYLQATPLLHLGMRLGEGTGAALAIPLIQSAVLFLNEMASFASAGVSGAQP